MNYSNKTVDELKDVCRERKIKGIEEPVSQEEPQTDKNQEEDEEEEVSYFNSNVSIYSPEELEKHLDFNKFHNTSYNPEELEKLCDFANDTHLTLIDSMEYIKFCHNCGNTLQIFGNMYCNKRCCEYVEDYRYPCYKGKDCLICFG